MKRKSGTLNATRHVILANDSRLLREMLHDAIDRANQLEVVEEMPGLSGLCAAIERFAPSWVILSAPLGEEARRQIQSCLTAQPSVGVILLWPNQNRITMTDKRSLEEDYSDLSLKDFIQILKRDPQRR